MDRILLPTVGSDGDSVDPTCKESVMRNLTWIRVLTATLVTWTPTSALAGGPSRPLQKAAFSLKLEPGFQRLPFGQDLSATLRWIRSRARGSDARKRSLMKQLKRSVVRFDVGSDVAER